MTLGFHKTRTINSLRIWFPVIRNGSLVASSTADDFTVYVIDQNDSGFVSPFVTESTQRSGIYYFDIPSAFLVSSGTGDYNVSIEVNRTNPTVMDVYYGHINVTDKDIDSISATVSGNVNLTENAIAAISASVWDAVNTEHNTSGTFGSLIDLIYSGSGGGGSGITSGNIDQIVNAVWNEPAREHNTSGTMGWLQNQIIDTIFSGSGIPLSSASVDFIVDAIWNEPANEHNTSGTVGFLQNLLDDINVRTSSSFIIINDNLDVAVSTRAAPGDSMSLNPNTIAAISSSVWDAQGNNHNTSGTMGWFVQQVVDTLISGSGVSFSSSSVDTLVNAMWDEPINEHNLTGTMGALQGLLDDINATTNNSYTIINSNLDVAVSSRAAPGDAMLLTGDTISSISSSVWNALESNHIASGTMGWLLGQMNELTFSGSVNLTSGTITDLVNAVWNEPANEHNISGTVGYLQNFLDNINSTTNNSYQIINTNLDATISSRAASGEAMQLTANTIGAISSSVWEAIDTDHNTSGTMGFLLNLIDEINVKTSSSLALISTDGVSVASSSIDQIVDATWDELVSEHTISGSTARTLSTAGAGGVDLDLLADAVWDRTAATNNTSGTMGWLQNKALPMSESIDFIRGMTAGRWAIVGSQMIFYAEDNTTELARYNLTDTEGDAFFSEPNAPAERTKV